MNPSQISTRREFLQKGMSLVAASAVVPIWLNNTAYALDDPRDVKRVKGKGEQILIVLQLSGGNDVLSTVVPYGMEEYYRHRRTTAIRKNEVLKLNDTIGLNPRLQPLKALYDAGDMAIVQGVSYPNPNRSHFHSMNVWHTCNSQSPQSADGWLARYVEAMEQADPTVAISLGSETPKALIGRKYRGISFQDPGSFRWRGAGNDEKVTKTYRGLNMEQKSGNSNLDFLSTTAMEANAATDSVRRAVARFRPTGRYRGRLGRDMATVAAMIAGGLKTRLYYVRQGGFDTHSNQRGRHDNLMTQLASNVQALMTDLKKTGNADRVVIMAFSEFGRRVGENASGGTDHGAGGAMFLFGKPVKGGIVGEHPSLTKLDRGDLQWSIDFRSVYGSVIDSWMGGNHKQLFGKQYKSLKLL